MSIEQLGKKKATSATPAVPIKAAPAPRNVPEKPPIQSPKTNLQDIKKAVKSDQKLDLAKTDVKKSVPTEPKVILKSQDNKEKHLATSPMVAHEKPGRKAKEIEDN